MFTPSTSCDSVCRVRTSDCITLEQVSQVYCCPTLPLFSLFRVGFLLFLVKHVNIYICVVTRIKRFDNTRVVFRLFMLRNTFTDDENLLRDFLDVVALFRYNAPSAVSQLGLMIYFLLIHCDFFMLPFQEILFHVHRLYQGVSLQAMELHHVSLCSTLLPPGLLPANLLFSDRHLAD